MKIGIPCLQLKQSVTGRKGKHAGSAYHVACEALEERYSTDPDIQRDLTPNNTYEGFRSGRALFDYWKNEKDNHKFIDKNGKEKKPRTDISIGFACIVKPPAEWIESLSEADRKRFLQDSDECMKSILTNAGFQVDSRVTHEDEVGTHDHYLCHDPAYKMSSKVGLKLFRDFNKTYPQMMRDRGWTEIEDNITYDNEKAMLMNDDEKKAYKQECMRLKKRRKSGLNSFSYKRAKDYEKAYNEAITDSQADIQAMQAHINAQQRSLNAEKAKLEAEKRALQIKDAEIAKRTEETRNMRAKLEAEAKQFRSNAQKALEAEKARLKAEYEAKHQANMKAINQTFNKGSQYGGNIGKFMDAQYGG